MQVTVESLSIDEMGRYPDFTTNNDDIDADLPPNFANPYTGGVTGINAVREGLVDDATDGVEGYVYYQSDPSGDYAATSYSISGACKDGEWSKLTLIPGK